MVTKQLAASSFSSITKPPTLQPDDHLLRFGKKHSQFIRCNRREVMLSGGMGAGKTVAALAKVVARAMRPKAFEVIARKYLHDCKATAIKQLLEGDGKTPALLPPGSYTHNKAERIIRLNEGGTIYYMGICNSDGSAARIGSLQATGIFVEQAEEIDEGAWQMLLGRIRSQADGLANQLYGVCNPGAPTHWLVKRFAINHPQLRPDHTEYIPVTTYDNAHNLPEGYIDGLLTMDPWRKARYVFGEWVGATGVIYDNFRNDLHVTERAGPWIRARIGVDDGHTNPTAMLLALQADDGRWHIAAEVYKPAMLLSEKKAAVKALAARVPNMRVPIIVDSAAAGLIAELRAEGLPVRGAHKEVLYGIGVVRQLFNLLNGQPQLTISPQCGDLIRELNAYQWRDDHADDAPLKENDHAPDALRYLAMDIHVAGNEEASMSPIETHIANADDGDEHGPYVAGTSPEELDAAIARNKHGDLFKPGRGKGWREWAHRELGHNYVVAAAHGGQKYDSIIVVLDARLRVKVAEYRGRPSPADLARQACAAAMWWSREMPVFAPIMFKADGEGEQAVKHASRIYQAVKRGIGNQPQKGWLYDPRNQNAIMTRLREQIAACKYTERSTATLDDMAQYEPRRGTMLPRAMDTSNDDPRFWVDGAQTTAMALWMAERATGNANKDREAEGPEEPPI